MAEHEHKEGHDEAHASGSSHGHSSHAGHGGGHADGEHEGAPEWLISFADNVALLMGFFVILLAMNMAKQTAGGIGGEGKMGGNEQDSMMEFVLSVRSAFNNPVDVNSKRPEDQALIRYLLKRTSGEADQAGPKGRFHSLQSLENGTVVRVTANVTFEDRSALLSTAARETIADAASRLKDQRWIIEVRGHVSPFEVMHNQIRARELSYERALAVAAAMVDHGVQWNSLRVVACGDGQRVVPRAIDRDEDRSNQRVEIVVTTETAPEDPYAAPVGVTRAAPEPSPDADPIAD